jgi:hypothetical protein
VIEQILRLQSKLRLAVTGGGQREIERWNRPGFHSSDIEGTTLTSALRESEK